MSKWIDINKEDIDIDGDEISFLVTGDDDGNIYAVLSKKDIEELIEEVK